MFHALKRSAFRVKSVGASKTTDPVYDKCKAEVKDLYKLAQRLDKEMKRFTASIGVLTKANGTISTTFIQQLEDVNDAEGQSGVLVMASVLDGLWQSGLSEILGECLGNTALLKTSDFRSFVQNLNRQGKQRDELRAEYDYYTKKLNKLVNAPDDKRDPDRIDTNTRKHENAYEMFYVTNETVKVKFIILRDDRFDIFGSVLRDFWKTKRLFFSTVADSLVSLEGSSFRTMSEGQRYLDKHLAVDGGTKYKKAGLLSKLRKRLKRKISDAEFAAAHSLFEQLVQTVYGTGDALNTITTALEKCVKSSDFITTTILKLFLPEADSNVGNEGKLDPRSSRFMQFAKASKDKVCAWVDLVSSFGCSVDVVLGHVQELHKEFQAVDALVDSAVKSQKEFESLSKKKEPDEAKLTQLKQDAEDSRKKALQALRNQVAKKEQQLGFLLSLVIAAESRLMKDIAATFSGRDNDDDTVDGLPILTLPLLPSASASGGDLTGSSDAVQATNNKVAQQEKKGWFGKKANKEAKEKGGGFFGKGKKKGKVSTMTKQMQQMDSQADQQAKTKAAPSKWERERLEKDAKQRSQEEAYRLKQEDNKGQEVTQADEEELRPRSLSAIRAAYVNSTKEVEAKAERAVKEMKKRRCRSIAGLSGDNKESATRAIAGVLDAKVAEKNKVKDAMAAMSAGGSAEGMEDEWGNKDPGVINFNNTTVFQLTSKEQLPTKYRELCEAIGANALATTLLLANADLDDQWCLELAQLLESNTTLTEINLNTNPISGKGVTHLAKALYKNGTLKTLKIHNLSRTVDHESQASLLKAVEANRSLCKLAFHFSSKRDNELRDKYCDRNVGLARKRRNEEKKRQETQASADSRKQGQVTKQPQDTKIQQSPKPEQVVAAQKQAEAPLKRRNSDVHSQVDVAEASDDMSSESDVEEEADDRDKGTTAVAEAPDAAKGSAEGRDVKAVEATTDSADGGSLVHFQRAKSPHKKRPTKKLAFVALPREQS